MAFDTVRKSLAHLEPAQPQADAFGQGLYSQQWTARTYDALLNQARAALSGGRSVLLDASFLRRVDRQAAVQIARAAATQAANVIFVECFCPRETALQRLALRWKIRIEQEQRDCPVLSQPETALLASHGRPDLYDSQCTAWQPFDSAQEAGMTHLVVNTALPLAINVEQVLEDSAIKIDKSH